MRYPTAALLAASLAPCLLAQEEPSGEGIVSEQKTPAVAAEAEVSAAIERAARFLAEAQKPNGAWEALSKNDVAPLRDIGVTALACLALMDVGHDPGAGAYKQVVRAGLAWLADQQQEESGLVGEPLGHAYLYDHAIATLALAEGHRRAPEAGLEAATRAAVELALRARNPYGAWRYDLPPSGDADTSVTGWMATALHRAVDAGIAVDDAAFAGALLWIEEVTDTETGRVGYDAPGSTSSRIPGVNENYAPDRGEGMTAVGLYLQLLLQGSQRGPHVDKHVALLLKKLPAWDPEGLGADMYYWHFGTRALHAHGGRPWSAWRTSLEEALLESQAANGSWDPVGPWGMLGGRSYSTALMLSCLALHRH